jgi:hypothetical protein
MIHDHPLTGATSLFFIPTTAASGWSDTITKTLPQGGHVCAGIHLLEGVVVQIVGDAILIRDLIHCQTTWAHITQRGGL